MGCNEKHLVDITGSRSPFPKAGTPSIFDDPSSPYAFMQTMKFHMWYRSFQTKGHLSKLTGISYNTHNKTNNTPNTSIQLRFIQNSFSTKILFIFSGIFTIIQKNHYNPSHQILVFNELYLWIIDFHNDNHHHGIQGPVGLGQKAAMSDEGGSGFVLWL